VSERTAADDTVDALLLQASPQLSGAAEPHVEASDALDIVATAAAVAAAAAVSAPAPAMSADAPSAPADSWAAVAGATVLADSVAAAACAAAAAAALFVDVQEPQGPAVNEAAASDAAVAAGPALAVHGVNSPAAQESAVSTLADMAAETALAVAAVGCGEATDRHGAVCQQAAASADGASSAGSSGPLFGSSPSASLVSFHLPEQYAVAGCGEAVESPTAVPAGSSRPVFGSSAGLGLVSFHLPELQAEASAARGGGATETPVCEQAAVSAGGSDHVFGHGPSAGLVSFHLPELQAEASAALSDRSSVWAAVPARGLLGSDASGYEAGAGGDPFQQGAAAGLAGGLPQNELLQVRAGLLCILSPSISHRSSLLPLSVWCH
jgi:flagellar hook-length control protein FliK